MYTLELFDVKNKQELINKKLISEFYLDKYLNKGVKWFIMKFLRVYWNDFYILKDNENNSLVAAGCLRYKINLRSYRIEAWYYGIIVGENYRGKGISKILLRELEKQIKSKYKSVSLYVQKDNIKAIRLYLKIGFEQIGETDNSYLLKKLL